MSEEPDLCDKCGGPQPCDKRACMEALLAEADYYDEEAKSARDKE